MHWISFAVLLFLFQQPVLDPPTPTLDSIEPSSVVQGTTVAITFRGTGFVLRQSWPEMPMPSGGVFPGIMVAGPAQWLDENTITVLWRVMAPAGKYYMNISTSPPYESPKRSNLLPFTVLAAARPSTPEFEVTTFAGKPGGPGAANGRGEAARFVAAPAGIWGDGKFLYVSDNHAIRRVEIATGMVTSVAGVPYIQNYADGRGSEARLNYPGPLWGDGANLFVLEGAAATVRKVAIETGEVTTLGARGQIRATEMTGFGRYLYFGQGRTIYGFDREIGRYVWARPLDQVNTSPGYGDRHIPLWSDGQAVYVVDNGPNDPQRPRSVIRRIDLATLEIANIAGSSSQIGYVDGPGTFARFNHPTSLWGDGMALFLADTENRAIRKIDLMTNEVSTLAGVPGPGPFPDATPLIIDGPASTARFNTPGRIWGDGMYLYVSDLFVIRRVTIATGEVTTLAGSPWSPGADDGIGTAARFVHPGSITGSKNVLYVLDGLRGALRSVNTINAEIRTIGYISPALLQAIWTNDDNIYTVDPSTGVVQSFEIKTSTIRPVGSLPNLGPVPVSHYRSIWGDGRNLYIGGNKKIYKVVIATGDVSVLAGKGFVTGASDEYFPKDGIGTAAQFINPTGLWGDGDALYVTDSRLIRRVQLSTAEVTTIAGADFGITDGVGTDARFLDLRAICGDGRYLYVIEFNSSRVRRIAIDSGEVATIAGEYGKWGSEDGPGTVARFAYPDGIWAVGASIYVSDGMTIRRLSPIPAPTSKTSVTVASNGSTSFSTSGTAADVRVGYAKLTHEAAAPIAGTALFRYRQNGILVTEAGVPATHAMQRGRIYTASGRFVRTGIAIANPNAQPVTVSFSYTDDNGVDFGAGTTTIAANGQIARFLDENPFNTTTAGRSRSLTFNASAPVAVIALRGFTNERSEFLVTTLSVTDLSEPKTRIGFPQFATGGGWTTTVALVNPTDSFAEGEMVFLQDDGGIHTRTAYVIAPRSTFTVGLTGATAGIQTGHARVSPKAGHTVPDGVLLLSYKRDGITVTETSIPAVEPGSILRTYVEATAAVQTGIALANGSTSETTVSLSVVNVAGEDLGVSTTLRLPANGHTALFLREIPAFASLPSEFRGVLRVVPDRDASLSAVALRGRYNERGDFLVSTTQVADERAPSSSDLMFPHFAEGGGYTTDFILFTTSSQSATGTLQFSAPSGEPMTLQLR